MITNQKQFEDYKTRINKVKGRLGPHYRVILQELYPDKFNKKAWYNLISFAFVSVDMLEAAEKAADYLDAFKEKNK